MIKHYTIRVFGLVQGVFFRSNAKERAQDLGLTGLASNEADGSVRLEAEGEESLLQSFLRWCHQGSKSSRVSKVEVEEGVLRNFQSFEIL